MSRVMLDQDAYGIMEIMEISIFELLRELYPYEPIDVVEDKTIAVIAKGIRSAYEQCAPGRFSDKLRNSLYHCYVLDYEVNNEQG